MFRILLQTAREKLNSLICVVHFSKIVFFIKKRLMKLIGALAV